MTKGQENNIFDLIGRLIQILSSSRIAIDDRHTPKLYARFLAGLLSRHRRDGTTVGRLQPVPPVGSPFTGNSGNDTSQPASTPTGSFASPTAVAEQRGQSQELNQASLR